MGINWIQGGAVFSVIGYVCAAAVVGWFWWVFVMIALAYVVYKCLERSPEAKAAHTAAVEDMRTRIARRNA